MSDRVAFVGGSTSERDHFPWPVPEVSMSNPPDTWPYKVAIDLDSAMKWVWRVKKWAIRGTISWTAGLGDYSITFISDARLVPVSYNGAAFNTTREAQLVILYVVNDEDMNNITFTKPGGSGDISFDSSGCIMFDNGDPLRPPMLYDSTVDKFYPKVFFNFSTSGAGNIENSDNIEVSFFDSSDPVAGSINIDGTGAYDLRLTSSGSDVHTGSITGEITLTPSSFWPYKLRDGSPVWDTGSGAQLEDPLVDYDVDDIEETITGAPDAVTPSTLIIHRNPSPWIAV